MAAAVDATITVGDRQFSLPLRLLNPDGTLATLTTLKLRMVNVADNTVKVNDAACTVASFTSGGLACNARYDWAAGDVDTAGTYAIQVWDATGGGLTQRWPAGRELLIEIKTVI